MRVKRTGNCGESRSVGDVRGKNWSGGAVERCEPPITSDQVSRKGKSSFCSFPIIAMLRTIRQWHAICCAGCYLMHPRSIRVTLFWGGALQNLEPDTYYEGGASVLQKRSAQRRRDWGCTAMKRSCCALWARPPPPPQCGVHSAAFGVLHRAAPRTASVPERVIPRLHSSFTNRVVFSDFLGFVFKLTAGRKM